MADYINVSKGLNIKQKEEPIELQVQTNNVSYRKNNFERIPQNDTLSFKGQTVTKEKKDNTGTIIAIIAMLLLAAGGGRAWKHGNDILKQSGSEAGFKDSFLTGCKNFFTKTEESDLVKTAKEAKQKAEQEAKRKAEAEAKAKLEEEAKKKAEEEAKRKTEQSSGNKHTTERATGSSSGTGRSYDFSGNNRAKSVHTENKPEPSKPKANTAREADNIAIQKPAETEENAIRELTRKNKEERARLNCIGNNHIGASEQEIRATVARAESIATKPKEGRYNYVRNGNSYVIEVGKDGKVIKYTVKTGKQTKEVTDSAKIAKFLDKNPDALKAEPVVGTEGNTVVQYTEQATREIIEATRIRTELFQKYSADKPLAELSEKELGEFLEKCYPDEPWTQLVMQEALKEEKVNKLTVKEFANLYLQDGNAYKELAPRAKEVFFAQLRAVGIDYGFITGVVNKKPSEIKMKDIKQGLSLQEKFKDIPDDITLKEMLESMGQKVDDCTLGDYKDNSIIDGLMVKDDNTLNQISEHFSGVRKHSVPAEIKAGQPAITSTKRTIAKEEEEIYGKLKDVLKSKNIVCENIEDMQISKVSNGWHFKDKEGNILYRIEERCSTNYQQSYRHCGTDVSVIDHTLEIFDKDGKSLYRNTWQEEFKDIYFD